MSVERGLGGDDLVAATVLGHRERDIGALEELAALDLPGVEGRAAR